jgi:hypothetical protein
MSQKCPNPEPAGSVCLSDSDQKNILRIHHTGDEKGPLAVPEYGGVHQDHIRGELLVVDGGEVGGGKVLQHAHVTLQVRGAPHLLHHQSQINL